MSDGDQTEVDRVLSSFEFSGPNPVDTLSVDRAVQTPVQTPRR